jgi:Lon protease-like protein
MSEIPLFPLQTVLFPGGPLPLRIFEPRYLDMVSRCLKHEQGFGVCLIAEGVETGRARTHTVGTLAHIRDWSGGPEGLLHILAVGRQRFRTLNARLQTDGLNLGEVEWLPDEASLSLPDEYAPLADLLRQILGQMQERYAQIEPAFGDASWVGYRLAETLPISLPQRQYLLEMSDASKRLEIIATLVKSLSVQ